MHCDYCRTAKSNVTVQPQGKRICKDCTTTAAAGFYLGLGLGTLLGMILAAILRLLFVGIFG